MKQRIALISEHASPLAAFGGADSGGQNVYVGELAKQLALMGYKVDIFTRREDINQPQIVDIEPGVRIVHVTAGPRMVVAKEKLLPFMEEFTHEMVSFIKSQKLIYQLVHANFFMSGLVAVQLKHQLNLPFVVTFHALGHIRKRHQQGNDLFPAERCQIEKLVAEEAEKVIAECPQDREDMIEFYEIDAEKIVVVPCGFNTAEFFPMAKSEARERLGIAKDEKIILQLGRMVARKGIDNVIEALAKLPAENQAKLLVVGGEINPPCAEYQRLHALAAELGVADQVVFTGSKTRAELNDCYNAADVFVTTPWYEPFGITPLEAMACALPVIGANVGGIKYTVEDAKTGFLVPPKDPNALADRLSLLLNNPALCQDMGSMGYERVHLNFTWAVVAKQIDRVYKDVLEDRQLASQVETVQKSFEDAALAMMEAAAQLGMKVAKAATLMASALRNGNKILICGNGGSAAESQHLAAELVGRFEMPFRKGLPVISLTADTSILTAWSNDFGFDEVFARQVQAYGQTGDILVCLSTSGNSKNLVLAAKEAKAQGMICINLLGKDGGKVKEVGDLNLIVPSANGQRIQEVHLHLVHSLCSLIEQQLFASVEGYKKQKRTAPLQVNGKEDLQLVRNNNVAEMNLWQQRYGS